MPFEIVRNNIVHMQVDAIVNAANASLLGGGGVDGAIHRAAGPQLLEECRGLGGCATGQAKITRGYRLPARYVIHTVGPVWNGGWRGEEHMLRSCYRSSLELAQKHGCESVAFPLISAGAYGYPPAEAMRVAMDEIRAFLMHCDMLVYLVVFGQESFRLSTLLSANVKQYIDDHYVQTHFDPAAENRRMQEASLLRSSCAEPAPVLWDACAEPAFMGGEACAEAVPSAASLDEALEQIDESFSQMVLRKIDEQGMTDPECYKRANLDRKLFSKIRKDPFYRPNKRTALALAIALKLPLSETKDLLMKAGFALSHSSRFDIIVEYCIVQGMFDIFEINALLFEYDQALLGA